MSRPRCNSVGRLASSPETGILVMGVPMRAAIYARVSTVDQNSENQLIELRRYCEARGWPVTGEYVDQGVSGTKERRPALDELLRDAKRRRMDVICCWSLDRLGRSLKNLIHLLDEFQSLRVSFVSLREGLDGTTAAGRLQWQIIGAISEFEKSRATERIHAGLARARAQGVRLGRPPRRIDPDKLAAVAGLPEREAARRLGIPHSTLQRALARKPAA